jgi:anti-sigma B factor antagonist
VMSEPLLVIEKYEGPLQGQCVLRLKGPLTEATSSLFQRVVRRENAETMILDLTEVPYVDSVGLGLLVGAYVTCQKTGRRLAFSGANARVFQLFQITKLEPFFLLFPTLEEAVEGFSNAGRA